MCSGLGVSWGTGNLWAPRVFSGQWRGGRSLGAPEWTVSHPASPQTPASPQIPACSASMARRPTPPLTALKLPPRPQRSCCFSSKAVSGWVSPGRSSAVSLGVPGAPCEWGQASPPPDTPCSAASFHAKATGTCQSEGGGDLSDLGRACSGGGVRPGAKRPSEPHGDPTGLRGCQCSPRVLSPPLL